MCEKMKKKRQKTERSRMFYGVAVAPQRGNTSERGSFPDGFFFLRKRCRGKKKKTSPVTRGICCVGAPLDLLAAASKPVNHLFYQPPVLQRLLRAGDVSSFVFFFFLFPLNRTHTNTHTRPLGFSTLLEVDN